MSKEFKNTRRCAGNYKTPGYLWPTEFGMEYCPVHDFAEDFKDSGHGAMSLFEINEERARRGLPSLEEASVARTFFRKSKER